MKKEHKIFLILSILTLNVFYLVIFIYGEGEFLSIGNYYFFFTLTIFAYLTQSFGVAKFKNLTVVPHFFALFPMLAAFGPIPTSIIAYANTILAYRKNYDLYARFYGGVQYALSYYIAGVVMQIFHFNWIGIVLSLLTFKLVNSILVDMFYDYFRNRWHGLKNVVKNSYTEVTFFSLTTPMVFMLVTQKNSMSEVFIVYTLVFPVVFAKLLSIQAKSNQELKKEKIELSKSLDKLKKILEVSEMLKVNMSLIDLMMRVASIIHNDLGWEYVLVSMITPDGKVNRVAYAGIEEKDFERLKKNPPPLEMIRSLMKEEFKVSHSYFIPEEAMVDIPAESSYLGKYEVVDAESWRERDLLWIPITDRNGKMIAFISPDKPLSGKRPSFEDIAILEIFANQVFIALENSSEFEKLQEKAIRDTQTGLYNHTEFYNKLEGMVERDEKVCLVMIDIDDFKIVNDTYGHQMGDKVIAYISEVIKRSIRQEDIAARYGGEEFAIILRGIEGDTARKIAERLRISIAAGSSPVKITISLGVACRPKDALESNDIVMLADKALYMAKMRGKNRVVLAKKKS